MPKNVFILLIGKTDLFLSHFFNLNFGQSLIYKMTKSDRSNFKLKDSFSKVLEVKKLILFEYLITSRYNFT